MDENKARQIKKRITIISGVILGAVVIYMVYCGFVLKKLGSAYPFVISAGIILFWVLQEVVSPILTKEFEGKTKEQMAAYKFYAGLGLIGYLGLVFFAAAPNQQYGFYGAIVYAVSIMMKRRFLDDFRGNRDEADDDTENPEDESEEKAVPEKTSQAPQPGSLAEKMQRFASAEIEEDEETFQDEMTEQPDEALTTEAAEQPDETLTAEAAEQPDDHSGE